MSGLPPIMHAMWYSKVIKKKQDHLEYELEGMGYFFFNAGGCEHANHPTISQRSTLHLSTVLELLRKRGL